MDVSIAPEAIMTTTQVQDGQLHTTQARPQDAARVAPRLKGAIVVPVDFSAGSRRALDVARALARRLDAPLDVLHVWQSPPILAPDVSIRMTDGHTVCLEDYAMHRAAEELERFLIDLPAGERVRGVLRNGGAADTILRYAEDAQAGMIILATHGRRGLERLLMGSVTEHVLRRATCPVLAVPGRGAPTDWPQWFQV
jgi:nucleotide-binding universal stress UspA family protein